MKRCVSSTLLPPVLIVSLGVFLYGRLEAQTFTTLHNFGGQDGTRSAAALTVSGNSLFGTSPSGGTFGGGTVFKINTDGTGFTNLYSFSGTNDGSAPQSGLVQSGTTLYGTTTSGGKFNGGTLFAIQMDGSGFTNLYNFPTNSGGPSSLLLAGDRFFGTFALAGSFVQSTLFVVGIDGSGFTTLFTFNDGQAGKLTLSGSVLYGTTRFGGNSGEGSVFSINTDGTGYTTLHSFGPGYLADTGVILSGDTLYGTTTYGGSNGLGTVFAVKTNGTDFTELWSFSPLWHEATNPEIDWNIEGAYPNGLILNDNVLYGTASAGADWGRGSVFAINPNGVVLWVPYTFSDLLPQLPSSVWPYPRTNSDGVAPLSTLVLAGNTAYGTTTGGGAFSAGTIFSLVLPPAQLAFTTQTNNKAICITGFIGSGNQLTIPPEINGLPVTSIGTNAFAGAVSLTSVTIPNSLTNIGVAPFSGTSLTAIIVETNNPAYSSAGGVLFDKSQATVIEYPARKAGPYSIPNGVTTIGDFAFFNSISLTSVTIPNGVTNIGGGAFGGCTNLTNAAIPNSVISIGEGAFTNCTSLSSVAIPNSVTSIGDYAFQRCIGLTNLTIGNGFTSIGDSVFAWCVRLASVMIPGRVTFIGGGAFSGCLSLRSVYFQSNAPSLGQDVFDYLAFDGRDGSLHGFFDPATSYYLPGTTGWFALATNSSLPSFTGQTGIPVALWLPQIRPITGSFGMSSNQFDFNINWASGWSVVVESSPTLNNPAWSPVTTNNLVGGSFYFTEPQWTNYPSRFYRVRSQ